jgi:hypothetical protein
MPITIDNLFSGTIGACLGVGASFGLNWFNRHRDSRLKLVEILLEIRHVSFYAMYASQIDDSPRFFSERYLQIKIAFFSVLQWCYPWERRNLINAWLSFKGEKTSEHKESDRQYDIIRDYHDVFSRTEPLLKLLKALKHRLA